MSSLISALSYLPMPSAEFSVNGTARGCGREPARPRDFLITNLPPALAQSVGVGARGPPMSSDAALAAFVVPVWDPETVDPYPGGMSGDIVSRTN